jgi:hypothetical protein
MDDRTAKIRKYNIISYRDCEVDVDFGWNPSPQEVIDGLTKGLEEFKEKYGTNECNLYFRCYEGDVENVSLNKSIPKTDAEIDAEIERAESKERERDYQTFLALKTKFEGS